MTGPGPVARRSPLAHHARATGLVGSRRSERGFVAGGEVLPFGVLIFVFGTLLLVNAWSVIDAKFAVASASREAARTYAESDGTLEGEAAARSVATETIEAYGYDGEELELSQPTGAFVRCGTVTYSASYPVPAIRIPLIGGFGSGFTVTSSHSTRIDQLRTGLGEESAC